ncbi:hypothetical protein KBD59_01155 [Candidatus Gracilibacteria bacterium]|nr:hypothetical protein [Candidatus Gracilibacteria bacterium]
MNYQEITEGIKNLTIQGAENIAVAGVQAFGEKLKETQDPVLLQQYIEELSNLRVTEPALRNGLAYCMRFFKERANVVEEVMQYFKDAKTKIAEIGSQKIHDGMTVFTHCHASTVTAILMRAWDQGKRFTVRNTETRPKFQGRKTAEELAKHGIPVIHGVDSTGRLQLKESDLFLFGADAVTVEGNVVNKIGTTMFAQFAHNFTIPTYSCTNSWKFDPATIGGKDEPIEERSSKEVWENQPANISIINPAFELTNSDQINGIITELGVFKPETLVSEVQKAYPWMIK